MVRKLPHFERWSLRIGSPLAAGGFPIEIPVNRSSKAGERLAARLGPDEWLLVAPSGDAPDFAALEGRHHSLVDVSHRYAAFAVEGAHAALVLAAGCPLDLDAGLFTAGTATRTLLGKAEIVLWRLEDYRLECARSFAPYVERFLNEAAREYS